jgi:hypothetical protein
MKTLVTRYRENDFLEWRIFSTFDSTDKTFDPVIQRLKGIGTATILLGYFDPELQNRLLWNGACA